MFEISKRCVMVDIEDVVKPDCFRVSRSIFASLQIEVADTKGTLLELVRSDD